ncbi:hypothetical protein GCM10007972_23660 [Iodidimonas muriae]|uniref:Flagellar hook-basal body complex protein FliE n=1 Tax=Iodidimonas muriae TaxID=261467 RepID=A0ABQ2LGD5_9PROT|nr:flagellar hook-basal body complex protein FliE [Iodidimonas muriae]GER08594.1 hypothetical protein JCM17843_29040 [Kordiimonadales bacterium JCM 17843]GGO15499.1 hypothetical protein GCM10007972_23660 [Iodidimonas muriae]
MVTGIFPVGQAAGAYRIGQDMGLDGPGSIERVKEGDFEAFMKAGVADAVATVRESEAVTSAAMRGKASVREVVQSVMAADLTVQSVVAVRDRLVSAYQEILRMPI